MKDTLICSDNKYVSWCTRFLPEKRNEHSEDQLLVRRHPTSALRIPNKRVKNTHTNNTTRTQKQVRADCLLTWYGILTRRHRTASNARYCANESVRMRICEPCTGRNGGNQSQQNTFHPPITIDVCKNYQNTTITRTRCERWRALETACVHIIYYIYVNVFLPHAAQHRSQPSTHSYN